MRLQAQKARIALFIQAVQYFRHVSVPCSGRNHFPVFPQGVLYMDIGNVRPQHFIGLHSILSALDKIREIKGTAEMISIKQFHQIQAPCRTVPVNALFIFMKEHHIPPGRIFHHPVCPAHHLIPELSRFFPFRHEKTEHPDK